MAQKWNGVPLKFELYLYLFPQLKKKKINIVNVFKKIRFIKFIFTSKILKILFFSFSLLTNF